MQIDSLTIKNFTCFESREFKFNPRFNLLVGENGAGKSSIIRALSVGIGSWFIGTQGPGQQQGIAVDDVRTVPRGNGGDYPTFEKQFPAHVECGGVIDGEALTWFRELLAENGRTTTAGAKTIRELASQFERKARGGDSVHLPLLLLYGAERLWFQKTHHERTKQSRLPSRFDGDRDCLEATIQETDFVDWVRDESLVKFQHGSDSLAPLDLVIKAIAACVEGADSIYYDSKARRVVVRLTDGQSQFLSNLSDGQRIMLTMVGDMARRIIQLNPQLGPSALAETRGVVLIDELDLHLHPRWQRHIIQDLKRTFPSIQFIATTHSPQLVGQAAPDEIILLDEQGDGVIPQSFGMDSNWVLKHIMGTSERDPGVATKLAEIESMIAGGRLEDARQALHTLRERRSGDDPDSVRLSTRIDRIERLGR
jgi:predicted ATP-binding protein involved in virulence